MLLCRYPVIVTLEDGQRIEVGCGRCLHCLKSKRSAWKQRLMAEWRYAKATYFCTLTYDDDALYGLNSKLNPRIKTESHFYIEDFDTVFFDVSKVDCQKFFKRFRRQFGELLGKFKYFLVSEFGDKSGRPHYHFLLFLYDKVFYDFDIHAMMLKTWRLGTVLDAQRVRGSGAFGYICDYMYKQVGDFDSDKEDELIINAYNSDYPDYELNQAYDLIQKYRKRPKSFVLSSRRPAIGISYLTEAKVQYHLSDPENNYKFVMNGVPPNIPLCSYLYNKIFGKESKLRLVKMQSDLENEMISFFEDNPDGDWDEHCHEAREFEHYLLKHKE